MHLIPPGAFDVFAKALFIGGAAVWALVCLWQNRHELRDLPKAIRALDVFTIGVLVCMVLFWVLLIGGRFWGGGTATMGVMSLLVLFMAGLIFWRRSAAD
jgi:hypothetical protein